MLGFMIAAARPLSDVDARSRVLTRPPVARRELRSVRSGALPAANRWWLCLLLAFPLPLSAQESLPRDRAEALVLADSIARSAAAADPKVIRDAMDMHALGMLITRDVDLSARARRDFLRGVEDQFSLAAVI